jgi:hypothetical protein
MRSPKTPQKYFLKSDLFFFSSPCKETAKNAIKKIEGKKCQEKSPPPPSTFVVKSF